MSTSALWEQIYLNDETLRKLCESPKVLRVPVGSCIHVRKGKGYEFNKLWYRGVPGYVIEDHIPQLEKLVSELRGWTLDVGDALTEKDWRRGWVDEYYALSSSPVFKCYVPGMVRVQLKLDSIDMARLSLEKRYMPVCPTCTLEQYEDKAHKDVFDEAMRYFIYFWLYGDTFTTERGEDDEGD